MCVCVLPGRLAKDDSLDAVDKDPPLGKQPDGSSQRDALDVGPLGREPGGAHAVVDLDDGLLDDGALVEVGGGEVGGGADDLDAAVVGLVVGPGALEGGEEGVVDVDDAAGEGGAEGGGEDLHVAGEGDEVDFVLAGQGQDLGFLGGLGGGGYGEVVEGDVVGRG